MDGAVGAGHITPAQALDQRERGWGPYSRNRARRASTGSARAWVEPGGQEQSGPSGGWISASVGGAPCRCAAAGGLDQRERGVGHCTRLLSWHSGPRPARARGGRQCRCGAGVWAGLTAQRDGIATLRSPGAGGAGGIVAGGHEVSGGVAMVALLRGWGGLVWGGGCGVVEGRMAPRCQHTAGLVRNDFSLLFRVLRMLQGILTRGHGQSRWSSRQSW